MKKVLLFAFAASIGRLFSQTPDFAWTRAVASNGDDQVTAMVADIQGNIYATGFFSGASVAFGTTTLNNTSSGSRDFFLVKYDRTGAVVWAKGFGGADDDMGTCLAIDGSGNVYAGGIYESASITPGTAALINSSNPGLSDMFLVKYNSAGTVLWAASYGGGLQDELTAISANNSGVIAITGRFYSLGVLFGSFGVVNSGLSDAFVAGISANGTVQWAKQIGGGQDDSGTGVGIDNSGNVYVAGDFSSSSVSSFSPALSNGGGSDIFIAKFNSAGSVLYASRIGGSGDESSSSLQTQSSGNFYITGYFESSSVSFGSTNLTNTGPRSLFFVKYNSAGVTQWAQKANAGSSTETAKLAGGSGSLVVTGSFEISALNLGSLTLSNGGSLDAFVATIDESDGSFLWARSSGSSALDMGLAVTVADGYVHMGGQFLNTLVLRDNVFTSSATDGFVTKLCIAPQAPVSASGTTVCPGSPVALSAILPANTVGAWYTSAQGGVPVHTGATYSGIGGTTYYVAAIDTTAGCNMISNGRISVTGSILPSVNPSISVSGHTLQAAGNGSVTAWYDCDNGIVIAGASGNNYVLNASGHYAVIMTSQQGCKDTSTCNHYSYTPGKDTVVVTVGILKDQGTSLFTVFPNPSAGRFTIRSTSSFEFQVFDSFGRKVYEAELSPDNNYSTSLNTLSAGVYFIISKKDPERAVKIISSP